ncbi:MAG: hypothetical protein K2O18_14385 [Oscillospiraceae bacterium]|nr:hypothetical protein [Oscillospiraceae bacterium]
MAMIIEKIFRRDISSGGAFDTNPGYGSVEICVNGCPQVSLEDKAAFLQNLESCLREAYIWTSVQFGMTGGSENEKPKDGDANMEK